MNKDDVSDAEMGPVRHPREGVGIDGWSAPLWAEDERGGPWDGTALRMTPTPTQQLGAPGGHTWAQDLDSVPGAAWAPGSWVKPGLLQTLAESRVSGAWET